MKNGTFLTFGLHGLILAVDVGAVKEILWLPELTVIEECPPYIAGVANIHGTLLPVMDLNIRFGHAARLYTCSDRIIILNASALNTHNSAQKPFGIIVNDVLDVTEIPAEDIELPPFESIEPSAHPHFLSGLAKNDQSIIMILNLQTMLDSEFEILPSEIDTSEPAETGSQPAISYFAFDAKPEEVEIFHNRAVNLQSACDVGKDSDTLIPVAVVSLNNEYLCVELESVREFSRIEAITPVPCCPDHVAGNMNLRGNILTLIDIRGLLHMQVGRITETAKVIVVDAGEFSVGVTVDEIIDIMNLSPMDLVPLPSSIQVLDDKFVKGAVSYGSSMMTLLDVKEILAWDGLAVNEEVL